MFPSEKPQRGSPYSQELIKHFRPYCTTRTTGRGEQLELRVNDQSLCYLILDGTIVVYRQRDNMMLTTARSPAVFGISNLAGALFTDYAKTITPCLIGVITIDKVNAIITEKALWGLVSKHLMFVSHQLYSRVMPQGAPTAYDMIRQQLILLMNEDENYRSSVTVEHYIREKTQLSRSGIMRILADLKSGGYVEMEGGRLVKIIKLPARY